MELYVDNYSGIPIYRQIVDQLEQQIITGILAPDTPLPSIRNLAKDLKISVITTKRAYEELETRGCIYTMPGKGCFVRQPSPALRQEAGYREIEEHLSAAWELALQRGVSEQELKAMLELIMEDKQ